MVWINKIPNECLFIKVGVQVSFQTIPALRRNPRVLVDALNFRRKKKYFKKTFKKKIGPL